MRIHCGLVAAFLLPGAMLLGGGCDPVTDGPEAEDLQVDIDAFRDVSVETGLDFQYFNGATGEFFFPEIMGAGAALLDFDNDGDLDVFMVQGDFLDDQGSNGEPLSPPPMGTANRLFRNELVPAGKLRFTEVSTAAGVDDEGYGVGAAVGDYDNDGDADLYVTNFGANVLYQNNGDGTFTDVAARSGTDDPG